jgi:hypothetical protein
MSILSKPVSPTAIALILSALSAAALVFYGLPDAGGGVSADSAASRSLKPFIMLLFLATGAGIAYWGIYAFTGKAEERHEEMVKFTYFIMVLSLALTALPPLIRSDPIGSEPVGLISGCLRSDDKASLLTCKGEKDASVTNNQWMLNLGGSITGQKEVGVPGSPANRAVVEGGITVPFPFLIVALFGGAISLSRRVPEIQRRADTSYVATAEAPKLTCADLREKMLFQIIQFISAPMIAIVAYQAFKPGSETAAAALAFVCGFGSETVLLRIRSLMDGIKPRLPVSATGPEAAAESPAGATVQLRIGVKDDSFDPGSLTLTINGAPAPSGADGLLEIEAEVNKEYVIEAKATFGGKPVSDKLQFLPLPNEVSKSIELNPV